MQQIDIHRFFAAPREAVFEALCDHEGFGRILGTRIERIRDSATGNPNGVGSIRRIHALPGVTFDETVIEYVPPSHMRYIISRGSPVKNHEGLLQFESSNGGTTLHYHIRFEPRIALPLSGPVLATMLKLPLERGLDRLATQLRRVYAG